MVFVSSFFSGAAGAGVVSFIGSPAFVSPAGAAGSAAVVALNAARGLRSQSDALNRAVGDFLARLRAA